MANTSGTTAYNPDLLSLTEEAWERASGGMTQLRSGYDLRTARRSLDLLLMDWANRGVNLWTLDEGSQTLTTGVAQFNLPPDTVDLYTIQITPGTQAQGGINMTRQSLYDFMRRVARDTTGRPTVYCVDRAVTAPTVHLWPVPDADYTVSWWRLRRIQDAGTGVNVQDVPFRFVPALVAGLAYHLASKIPEGAARISVLKAQYDEAWQMASDEDREKATLRLVPMVGRF